MTLPQRRDNWPILLVAVVALNLGGCRHFGGGLPSILGRNTPKQDSSFASATSSDPTAEQKANVQMAYARSLEKEGQADQAIKTYLEMIKKNKGQADACHRLAVLYDKKGDCQESQKYYQVALKKEPNNAEIVCDYGYSLYLQRRWAEAEAQFQQALKLDAELSRAHNNLGLLLARTGREAEALQHFVKGGCDEGSARSNLGLALALEQRWPEAQHEFQRALDADPNSKTAARGLAAMRSLQTRPLSPGIAVADSGVAAGERAASAGSQPIAR